MNQNIYYIAIINKYIFITKYIINFDLVGHQNNSQCDIT